jgi:hypothetical protein
MNRTNKTRSAATKRGERTKEEAPPVSERETDCIGGETGIKTDGEGNICWQHVHRDKRDKTRTANDDDGGGQFLMYHIGSSVPLPYSFTGLIM